MSPKTTQYSCPVQPELHIMQFEGSTYTLGYLSYEIAYLLSLFLNWPPSYGSVNGSNFTILY